MKKEVPIVMGFILGISIIAGVFITGVPWLTTWKNLLDEWFLVVQAWAVAVGVVNLTQIHSRRVSQKREGWFYSVWLIICMFGMIVFGVFIAKSPQNEGWRWMYNQLIAPMNATVYSTLVFYIGAAAYRAFRVRNLEATVLLGGTWIEKTADWILNVPNSAGMRGIQLGATLGAIATALRILVGIERGHLGGTGE